MTIMKEINNVKEWKGKIIGIPFHSPHYFERDHKWYYKLHSKAQESRSFTAILTVSQKYYTCVILNI